jgi:hypothetical protein
MYRRIVAVALAGALVGCASSENPPATGHGGDGAAGSAGTGGNAGSMSGGTAGPGTAGTVGSGGAGATGGAIATAGTGGGGASGGSAGSGGGSGGGATAATGGRGGSTGAAGVGGATAGQGGRGGAAGRGGSGGGTAGSSGSAGTTGAGGSSSACAGKTYKLCEDFETGTAGAFPTGWTALNGYGSDSMKGVGLATDQFHSGAMALKSSSMVPGQQRVQRSLSALGATAAKHWGRIFYKVISPSPKPSSGVIHVTMVALQGTTEDRVVDTVEQMNGTHQWLFNIPDDSCCTGSSYNWSFDAAWHCAEWYVDASTQSYRFFTDGTEVTQIGFSNRSGAKMSSFTSVGVGVIFYQAPPSPFTVWFDDLAIDDNQIGCQ